MDLLSTHPEELVDRSDPSDLLDSIRKTEKLAADQAATLDYAFRQWTMRAVSRQGDVEGLLELDDLIYLAGERIGAGDQTSADLRIRWTAFRDLLESKRLTIAGAGTGKASRLAHTKRILALLASGPITQAQVRQELELTPARVSQILGVLEEAHLIRRERRGKENVVMLPFESVIGGASAEVAVIGPPERALSHFLLRQLMY
jgi:hypothetical protein